MMQKELIKQ